MDTVFTLRIYDSVADTQALYTAVQALLAELDGVLSRTRAESDVSRINASKQAGDLSPHTLAVLELAHSAMRLTEGAYLPTMGAVSDLWRQAGEQDRLPDAAVLQAACAAARAGFTVENGVCRILGDGALLDLGGIGKGYAADCVLKLLQEAGVTGALLSFGSSVVTLGQKESGSDFRISIRHPRNSTQNVGTLINPTGVLSVSGDYERFVTVGGERYHHVLDPVSGYPTDTGMASVAVLCDSGALSDALSTAFMVMGQARVQQWIAAAKPAVEAVFIMPDGTAHTTTGITLTS